MFYKVFSVYGNNLQNASATKEEAENFVVSLNEDEKKYNKFYISECEASMEDYNILNEEIYFFIANGAKPHHRVIVCREQARDLIRKELCF